MPNDGPIRKSTASETLILLVCDMCDITYRGDFFNYRRFFGYDLFHCGDFVHVTLFEGHVALRKDASDLSTPHVCSVVPEVR